jgi:hypothetical protein
MKEKIKLFVMLWKVLNKGGYGWVFFRLDDDQQKRLITNKGDVNISIRYVGVDERVIKKVASRIEKPSE